MKLSGAQAKSYIKGANPAPLTLIFSENIPRARKSLQSLAKSYLGENARDEMRESQLEAKEASKNPALIHDAIKSKSFFPGPQAVLIFEATDAITPNLLAALEDWEEGDACIFVQAGNLKKTSKLRKTFEPHAQARVIGLYDDPLSPQEIRESLKAHAISLTQDAEAMFLQFALSYDASALDPLYETLALYQISQTEPLEISDLEAILPGQSSAAEDEIINALFRGDAKRLVQELRIAPAQGISMAGLNMMAIWRAKMLFQLQAASNPMQAMQSMRPPLFGSRRQAVEDNIRRWKPKAIEQAIETLSEAEREIRSGKAHLPDQAYLERVFLRVAMLSRS